MSSTSVVQLGYLRWRSPHVAAWKEIFRCIGAGEFELPQRELRAQLDSGQYRLAVEVADTSGAVELAWEVEGPAEFDEALKALTDAGARPEVRGDLLDERGVEGLARFQDPNGVTSELYWGRAGGSADGRAHPPGEIHFVSSRSGFGHVTYAVSDYDATRDFYMRTLGLRISDVNWVGEHKICFLKCNSRHHSFAFLEGPGPCSLRHAMVEVESIDDLGIARDRLLDAGVSLERDLGRHASDGMLSFYVHTPEKWLLEVGTSGGSRSEADFRGRATAVHPWGHRRI